MIKRLFSNRNNSFIQPNLRKLAVLKALIINSEQRLWTDHGHSIQIKWLLTQRQLCHRPAVDHFRNMPCLIPWDAVLFILKILNQGNAVLVFCIT